MTSSITMELLIIIDEASDIVGIILVGYLNITHQLFEVVLMKPLNRTPKSRLEKMSFFKHR